MPAIKVQKISDEPWEFKVILTEDDEVVGEYVVLMSDEEYERYGDDLEPQELIEATLAFLLAREEPEMIMEQFHLQDVEKYFPEYPDNVRDYI